MIRSSNRRFVTEQHCSTLSAGSNSETEETRNVCRSNQLLALWTPDLSFMNTESVKQKISMCVIMEI